MYQDATAHQPDSASTPAGLDLEALDTALFAWEWARALVGTSWVVADRTVIAEHLRGLTRQLVEALQQDPFAPAAGIMIGQSLVQAGFASPDALARTTILITQRFLEDLDLAHGSPPLDAAGTGTGAGPATPARPADGWLRERLAELVGMLSLGFVRAVRDRTLEQQDAIRSSALLALDRARADQRASTLRDGLTGLLNRDGFTARLGQLIERSPEGVVGICLLSLGGFEALDRGLGRDVGDQLALTVAKRLAARFDGDHELVARVGRDEFIVAAIDGIGGGSVQDAVASRLAAAQSLVRESIIIDGQPVVLWTSFGLVARPAGQTDPEVILRDADLAGSWGRARGPGEVAVFEAERASRQISDLALTAELPAALANNQLVPHYQPIISLRTGRIEAVEALVRWPHPKHGLLAPHRFLHLADRGGLMSSLGRAVLQQACRQGKIWQTELVRPPVVAVNLAAVQLTESGTVSDVVAVLEQTGLPADLLQLEITEHAALSEPGTLRIIRDLAGVGVGLALDDFGTGRAHLAQLAELPSHGVGTLKLPADFLHRRPGTDGLADDDARIHVFTAMIQLAHGLGMEVTVEGVETAAHHALVLGLGADLAQGAYYACPDRAEVTSRLLS